MSSRSSSVSREQSFFHSHWTDEQKTTARPSSFSENKEGSFHTQTSDIGLALDKNKGKNQKSVLVSFRKQTERDRAPVDCAFLFVYQRAQGRKKDVSGESPEGSPAMQHEGKGKPTERERERASSLQNRLSTGGVRGRSFYRKKERERG